MLIRRSFLKIASAAASSLAVYREPLSLLTDPHNDWLEDRGSFVIIKVPDNKTLKNITVPKPAIISLGLSATMVDVAIRGFANIIGKPGAHVLECTFDASSMRAELDRCVVHLGGYVVFNHNHLKGNHHCLPIKITNPLTREPYRTDLGTYYQ